jgi:hypothetical protein
MCLLLLHIGHRRHLPKLLLPLQLLHVRSSLWALFGCAHLLLLLLLS